MGIHDHVAQYGIEKMASVRRKGHAPAVASVKNVHNQWAQVGRVFDAHGEGRYAGLVHSDRLDIVGARTRPKCVVQWIGKALGHAIHGAAVLVDGRLRSGMHGRSRASCYILFVEPILA